MSTAEKIASSDTPSAEFRYFIFDPQNGDFTYFRTAEDRDAAADGIIQSYLDDGWDEEVENVIAGEVTHTCEKVNVTDRPPEDEIDGEGHDQNGDYWAEEWGYKCNYELKPFTQLDPGQEGFSAVDMATAAASGFRDGEAAARLVVTLPVPTEPERPEDAIDDSWRDGFNAATRMRKACAEAIGAAGGQVKP